jgi:hypothetical protein
VLLNIILFSLFSPAALADGPVQAGGLAANGWGLDYNWSYIRSNGRVDVAVSARNFTGQPLTGVRVKIEVNGVVIETDEFSLPDRTKFVHEIFRADPLPEPGQDIYVSATMCVENQCALPSRRKLNDARVNKPGAPLSTRVRYRLCEVRLMVTQDPDFILSANGQQIATGHLDAGEWSPWFDLKPYAVYPAKPLELTLEARWVGHAPVMEHFTIPAPYMNCLPPTGSVSADKIDQQGNPWNGVTIELIRAGQVIETGKTPATFENLPLGDYLIREVVPAGSEPIGPAEYEFRLDAHHLSYNFTFQNRVLTAQCNNVDLIAAQEFASEATVEVVVNATNASEYRIVRQDTHEVIAGPQSSNRFSIKVQPNVTYQAQVRNDHFDWSSAELSIAMRSCAFSQNINTSDLTCKATVDRNKQGDSLVTLRATGKSGREVDITHFKANSNFSYSYSTTPAEVLPVPLEWPGADQGSWFVQYKVSVDNGQSWAEGESCRLEFKRDRHTTGQYQDFIGAVPFGTFTPSLEPGKEYFDGASSVMYNVEYLNGAGQGDLVFRFNGQEISGVTTSIFHAGTFNQIESSAGRAATTFDEGVTKLIAYRYGTEQARIFQTMSNPSNRWIHPLDQPFEHKYEFQLELHGPAGLTDLLVYGGEQRNVQYDEQGIALVELSYNQPGLVAIYRIMGQELAWVTVDLLTFPTPQTVNHNFGEIGLYHYRIVDQFGQVVAGPSANPQVEFTAQPGLAYQAQLVYPETSLFVGLYNDMKFHHPDFWLMPIDGRFEHDHEFHLDYHRLNDPDLGNDHIRGDVVIDALYLTNATTSVAQQFPYGRHDGSLPGVTIVGIPNVSMVAFCQRPGYHEVVYWGGWENESYYLPERGWIFDEELAKQWTEDQRGDCIDAARRVNMLLAREGLRTDHTYRHHGERSQGYQMAQQNVWSPYNLVGMRPPHVGQLLKPSMVLPYYENPEDAVFWGWDLAKGGLADGIGEAELQAHVASLGPVIYGDQTGIHPPERD